MAWLEGCRLKVLEKVAKICTPFFSGNYFYWAYKLASCYAFIEEAKGDALDASKSLLSVAGGARAPGEVGLREPCARAQKVP